MAKLHIGSPKAWLTLAAFYLTFGILLFYQTTTADRASYLLLLGYFIFGSVIILIRMWRTRGNRTAFWQSAHIGQTGILPAKWRRWTLGE